MKEKIVLSYSKGITHSPSDLMCGDGELEECVNLEVKNGELRPMEMPIKLPFSLEEGETLLYIHNNKSKEKNYITIANGEVKIFKVVDGAQVYDDGFVLFCNGVKSIQSIGNTVVVYTEENPHYILYTKQGYKHLGSELPKVGLSPYLNGEFVVSDKFELNVPETESFENEDFQRSVSQLLLAKVNQFVEEKSTSKGRFMFPFLIRYALKMFDGTYTSHSAPILMKPSTNIAPFVGSNGASGKVDSQVGAFVADLKAVVSFISGSLADWSDVISSLDIFVSRQIQTYDQNGYSFHSGWTLPESETSKFVGKYGGEDITIWDGYNEMVSKKTIDVSQGFLHRWYIPRRSTEDIFSDITNTSLFYKFSSIDVKELNVNGTLELSGSLSALEVEETLPDDYMTNDILLPDSSFVYNGRLNISSVTRRLYEGYPLHCMDTKIDSEPKDGFGYGLTFGEYEVYTFIKSSSGSNDVIVKSRMSENMALFGSYFFYPDSDAYKMIIADSTNQRNAEVQLKEHPLLNGAYAFIGFKSIAFENGALTIEAANNEEALLNKLFVSNVNNMFHFPLEGIYTVGSDRIIGMGAVTRPISQGQFGEFPFIVFCSDGNYAMRVDSQGNYVSSSPVQEDVVLGSDKITPMENSLMIITKKGLMITTGGEMNKIVSQMDGCSFDSSALNGLNTEVEEFSNLVLKSSGNASFLNYVYGARMAFDYASNRLFIYNQEYPYSYVYNFDNDTIAKLVLSGGRTIVGSVMDYPDTILQDEVGDLYSLYTKADVYAQSDKEYGFMLTRLLKFGAALSMKSIKQLKVLSSTYDEESYAKYLLYGSNDNKNYYKVTSRFGKPYKYYRVAIYTHLLPKESLSGCALTVEERRTNKLR